MLNGPLTVAMPLLTAVPPELVTTKLACAVVPVTNMPKSHDAGVTAMRPGVSPDPLTILIELPPSLVKSTKPLNEAVESGANATVTVLVCPPATL